MLVSSCGRPVHPVSVDISKYLSPSQSLGPSASLVPEDEGFLSFLLWGPAHLALTHFFPSVINTSFYKKKPNFQSLDKTQGHLVQMSKGCTAQWCPPLQGHLWYSHMVTYLWARGHAPLAPIPRWDRSDRYRPLSCQTELLTQLLR